MADSGKGDELKGRLKKAGGELTDDDGLKREGQVDKAEGKIKQGLDAVGDKIRDATN